MSNPSATRTFPLSLSALLSQMAASLAARAHAAARRAREAQAPRTLALERNAIRAVARPLGRTIHCEAGALWLTFDNSPADVVLQAGESHLCCLDSRLLMQALQDARVRAD